LIGSGLLNGLRHQIGRRTSIIWRGLVQAIRQFICEWNERAHPFRRTRTSFDNFLTKVEAALPTTAPPLAEAA
jgi:hypothetical protein